jgi:hypothetical protein
MLWLDHCESSVRYTERGLGEARYGGVIPNVLARRGNSCLVSAPSIYVPYPFISLKILTK